MDADDITLKTLFCNEFDHSMSSEELASKELGEWRQPKAEEMAQIVVRQDTKKIFVN